jgi:hypothetical protein
MKPIVYSWVAICSDAQKMTGGKRPDGPWTRSNAWTGWLPWRLLSGCRDVQRAVNQPSVSTTCRTIGRQAGLRPGRVVDPVAPNDLAGHCVLRRHFIPLSRIEPKCLIGRLIRDHSPDQPHYRKNRANRG